MEKELVAQKDNKQRWEASLLRMHNSWFGTEAPFNTVAYNVIHHCITPRVLQSPTDALFCVKFIKWLHQHDTSGFPTVLFVDRVSYSSSSSRGQSLRLNVSA